MRLRWLWLVGACLLATPVIAQQVNVYWQVRSTGRNQFTPVATTNPLPVDCITGCGGGGGGGAVTIADGADVAQGTTTDGACAGDATSGCTVLNRLSRIAARLTTLITATGSPFQAGGSIGNTTFASTQGTSPWIVAGQTESVATTGAAASSIVAKASAGSVVSVSGSAVSGSYIMIFDATSAPADGAVTPVKCYGPMSSDGPFALGWGVGPYLAAATGITVVSSSTGCFTKTATNANFISVEYR